MKRNTVVEAKIQSHIDARAVGDLVLDNSFDYLEYICKILGITHFFHAARDGFEAHNKNTQHVYHNWFHTKVVALNTYEGLLYAGVVGIDFNNGMIAALFHDYAHRQIGGIKDDENIHLAISGFQKVNRKADKHKVSDEREEQICKYIRSTRFPHVGAVLKAPAVTRVLRDADMMSNYLCDKNEAAKAILGLFNEQEEPLFVELDQKSVDIFLEKQAGFCRKLQWHSQWGVQKAFALNWIHQSKVVHLHLKELLIQELNL